MALTTVFRICQLRVTSQRPSTRGRKHLLGSGARKQLITLAPASAENRRKPLIEIAYMAGITASEKTLRHSLASEGYHRRVARVKPFLKPSHLNVSIPFLFSLSCFFYIYLYNYFVYPFSFIFFRLYFAIGSYLYLFSVLIQFQY